jgi:hypothetical protein
MRLFSENLERKILLAGFALMFIGLVGFFISQLIRWLMLLLGSTGVLSITPALLGDVGFIFALLISIGALFFIVEYVLNKFGWAYDPVELLKNK